MSGSAARWCVVVLVLGCCVGGCGESPKRAAKTSPSVRKSPGRPVRPKRKETSTRTERQAAATVPVEPTEEPIEVPEPQPQHPETPRSLAGLMDRPADSAARWIPNLRRMQIDDARAAAAGIRKLSSKRLTLYTDMASAQQIDQLPEIFDRAFPLWCEYFHIEAAKHADWHMTGFLMQEKARFKQAGLLPDGLPPFKHGYARNYEFWWYDQPSDYYRRHLMLHEGTHGLMNTILGACGPPWYMEGMAELLATHRWQAGRLRLNHFPARREDVPHWGRIRIIKDAFAENRGKQLVNVIEYSANAHLETAPYAWCWAAAALLDGHPRYRDRFRQLYKNVTAPDFTEQFYRLMEDDWDDLSEEWQLLVAGLEYGHDVAGTAVDFTPGKPLPSAGATVTVAAKGGWQNSGWQVHPGTTYRLRASGRYQVAEEPQIWWCEPGGVSIRYYQGRPLGILLAAVRPDQSESTDLSPLLQPAAVGLGTTLSPKQTGTLYLKINDSAAELADNAGELRVEIKR